jgi:hypothetical protein
LSKSTNTALYKPPSELNYNITTEALESTKRLIAATSCLQVSMAIPEEPMPSPEGITLEKYNHASEIESVPVYINLSGEDSRWLNEFPEDKKKKAVRKVR